MPRSYHRQQTLLERCRAHQTILLIAWALTIFNPSYYADDWDGDGYDDDTGEWVDNTGGFDYGEDTSGYDPGSDSSSEYDTTYDYGYDDTAASSEEETNGSTDSDNDGLSDEMEIYGFEISATHTETTTVWVYDESTGESREEPFEYEYTSLETVYTDPYNSDSDFDLLPDKYEVDFGFHPTNPADGNADTDSDGLRNGEEYIQGTNHLNPDSDGDDYVDGLEVLVMLSNPLDGNDPEELIEEEPDETTPEESVDTATPGGSDGQSNNNTETDNNAQPVPGGEAELPQNPNPDDPPPSEETSPQPPPPAGNLNIEIKTIDLEFTSSEKTDDITGGDNGDPTEPDGGDGVEFDKNTHYSLRGKKEYLQDGNTEIRHIDLGPNTLSSGIDWVQSEAIPHQTDWVRHAQGAIDCETDITSNYSEADEVVFYSGSVRKREVRLTNYAEDGKTAVPVPESKKVSFLRIRSSWIQLDESGTMGWNVDSVESELETLTILSGHTESHETLTVRAPLQINQKVKESLLPVEFITSNPDRGGIEISDGTVSLTDATPVVEMEVTDAQLDGNGQLTVTVEGRMKDRLSEAFEDGGSRLQNLNFSVNGESESDTRSFQYAGDGTPPFSFANSETNFTKTFTVPDAQPGTYVFKAETDENAAGNTGWDKVAVTLYIDSEFTSVQNNGPQVSITFDNEPSDTSTDTAQIYYGSSPPASGATTVTESGAATNQFTGTIEINGETADCTILLGTIATDDQTQNRMSGTVRWTFPDGTSDEFSTIFLETGNQSLQFTPDPTSIQVGEKKLVIGEAVDLPGSQRRAFEPIGLRIPFGDDFDGEDVTIKVNGEDHKIKNLTYDGESSWYVVKSESDEHAKAFLPSVKPLPSAHSVQGIGNDTDDSKIEWSMQFAGQSNESKISDTFVMAERPEDDFEEGHPADGPSDYWKPGDTITREHLFTAYKFIYPDELSQILLKALLEDEADGNGELRLEDVYDNYHFNPLGFGGKYIIKIEHDDSDVHPGIAAAYLHQGLRRALGELTFKSRAQALAESEGIDVTQVDVLNAWREQVGPIAAQTGLVAAECYLAGIGIVNEGADWALVINDVSEGHYSSLAAILPFVPRGLVKAGETGLRVKNRAGDVLEDLSDVAKIDAVKELYRTRDLRVMGTLMDDAQMSASLRKAFSSNGGPIPVPKKRNGLKERMLGISPAPEWGKIERGTQGRKYSVAIAHHDFPWARRKWFADHGIDVNDPAFGRWVGQLDHDLWHNRMPTKFNDFWEEFIQAEARRDTPYTVGEILDKLAEARSTYSLSSGH